MEDERIKAVKQWPKPNSVKDIQVFLRFANFYWQFIQSFSYIAALFTSILKTIRSTGFAANLQETKNKVGGNSVVGNSMINGSEATKLANFIKKKKSIKKN